MPDDVSHDSVLERLVRMETKIDQILEANKDQETRIRTIERRVIAAVAAAIVVGTGAGQIDIAALLGG